MILERGDMWSVFGKTDLFLITTNPIIRKDGAVVMGRGIAKEAATKFPDLPYRFAKMLKYAEAEFDWMPQNVGMIGKFANQIVGWFMVKDHWAEPAKLDIIERSVRELKCVFTNGKPDFRVDLNFPGIGNGRLNRADVLPVLKELPDNVHVWEYA